VRFTLPCSKHANRRAYPCVHPVPSHHPHLDHTQLGFHHAVFVLLEQLTHCAPSTYPLPVSSLRDHAVPRRLADTLFWVVHNILNLNVVCWLPSSSARLRRLELELLELWCGSSMPKEIWWHGAGEGR
jgi:hypothetical protein